MKTYLRLMQKWPKFEMNYLNKLPFFDNLLFNKETGTVQTAIYLDKAIVNTKKRERFVFEVLNPYVEAFEKETGLDVRVSGMPLYPYHECPKHH